MVLNRRSENSTISYLNVSQDKFYVTDILTFLVPFLSFLGVDIGTETSSSIVKGTDGDDSSPLYPECQWLQESVGFPKLYGSLTGCASSANGGSSLGCGPSESSDDSTISRSENMLSDSGSPVGDDAFSS